ncbi:MAG: HAMP domain-containing protein, partial [Bradyrhizobium sp.]|uniref:HAMP domain-containing protein n=1 Tax=Bradyrhizobium sp. TaxID=376 RepID=UPI001D5DB16A
MSFLSRLSLAARLYSIFALFALLTASIAVLSDYNTRQAAELTHAIETANAAALNVERVNSLVYAVVMESRGVYMSADIPTARKFGDGLLKFNDRILDIVKRWQDIVRSDDAEQFATFKKRIEQFVEFRKELVRRGVEINPAAGREWGDNDANRNVRQALNKDLEVLSKVYAERAGRIAEQTETNRRLSLVLTGLGGFALLVVVAGVVLIAYSVARPLKTITATIARVAEGAEQVEVPHVGRADEIGELARAIGVFQQAMTRNRNLNAQVSVESQARETRNRHIEASVEEFRVAIGAVTQAVSASASTARNAAETITRVTAEANGRATAAADATTQASRNVSAVAGATEELSASVQEINRQVRQSTGAVEQTGQRTERSIAEI